MDPVAVAAVASQRGTRLVVFKPHFFKNYSDRNLKVLDRQIIIRNTVRSKRGDAL